MKFRFKLSCYVCLLLILLMASVVTASATEFETCYHCNGKGIYYCQFCGDNFYCM